MATATPSPLRLDEVACLEAMRRGEPGCLAPFFDAWADRLYGLAVRLLGDPAAAEDVVQEAFLKLMAGAGRIEGRSSLATWLYRVVYNASLDRLHDRQRELPVPDDRRGPGPTPSVLVDVRFSPEELARDAELARALDQAIAGLPPLLRGRLRVARRRGAEHCRGGRRDRRHRSQPQGAPAPGSPAAARAALRVRCRPRRAREGDVMNCQELVRSLSDYIDGALTPETKLAVEDHIAGCLDCHVVLDSTECTILLYRASRTSALSEDRRNLLLKKLEAACGGCREAKADGRS